MLKRNVLNSPRLQELKNNRRKVVREKMMLVFLGGFFIFIGFGFLTRISKLNIQNIIVSGNLVVDSEDIEKITREEMAGHYLWLTPKTNVFFYPKNKIKNTLAEEFSRLKDISLNVTNIETLEISVSEREGIYTWCGGELTETRDDEKCLFLDEDGYIIDVAPYFSGEVYFKFFGEFFKESKPVFRDLVLFKENIESVGLRPVGLMVKEDGSATMLLSSENTLGSNPELTFRVGDDLAKLAENLQSALDTEPLRTDIKKKYSLLEYIDLRYGNKVYYRFR